MLVRWIIYLLIWFALMFVSLKMCIQPECCGDTDEIGAVDDGNGVTDPVENTYAIPTTLNSGDVGQGADYADLRNRLIAEYQADPNQRLEVYGHYYSNEPTPDGFENMGFARAEQIARMLQPDIPLDKIDRLSRLLDDGTPTDGDQWEAGRFAWAAEMTEPGPQIIELSSDEITIRFPFDKSTKNLGAEVEDYLQKLATRLQQTNENVSITGHTDNVDTDAYNMTLGQARADFVKERLESYGAPADRITTTSQGESNPEASNSTSDGRAKNRRAVVKLTSN